MFGISSILKVSISSSIFLIKSSPLYSIIPSNENYKIQKIKLIMQKINTRCEKSIKIMHKVKKYVLICFSKYGEMVQKRVM